jgi:small subunit ribosomal protein S6|tara:strand:+ start:429 stop:752 length:324 start_codon:yes stop_codon:yes gene_type:complete
LGNILKNYEIVWIIGGDSENLSDESIKKMEETIISSNGEVVNVESMGKRSLAYPIKKNNEGIYFCINFQIDENKVKDLESTISLDQSIIRFLLVKASNKKSKCKSKG